ncbi:Allantoicase [Stylophora pistillata]|uniref:Allantoate amidinohydrolase n=1 Tax=Stylophora pistillata TaxID=50429 RepID=A0A2B4SN79_STYPI|nr:Allantoicase [Stylophora pistillata]
MDPLRSDLRHSIEFVLSRGNDPFHESDKRIGYLVTHTDRVFYILARASSLFNIPPQLECLLQRACLLFLVAVTTHCKVHKSYLAAAAAYVAALFTTRTNINGPRGGEIIFATDDWFAVAENLLKLAPPEWREGVFTLCGKWMDGWETRRKRIPGHDWCIIKLGIPGVIHGLDIDTSHFTGNYPPKASVQAACLENDSVIFPQRKSMMGSAASADWVKKIAQITQKKNLELKAQIEDLAEEIKNLKSQLANKDGDESTSAAAQAERDQRSPTNEQADFQPVQTRAEAELRWLSARLAQVSEKVDEVGKAIDAIEEYSFQYNIKIVGVPELSSRETAEVTSKLCAKLFAEMGTNIILQDIDIAN